MKWLALALCLLAPTAWGACDQLPDGSWPTTCARLTWTYPSQNVDGSALTDLFAFPVYRRCGAETTATRLAMPVTSTMEPTGTETQTWDDESPPLGQTCWYSLTAMNVAGEESARTGEVSKAFTATPAEITPAAPGNVILTWQIAQRPSMAVIESRSALAAGTRTNSTVTAPSGIANGDVLVYALSIGGASGGVTATPPSGFAGVTGSPVAYTYTSVDTWMVRLYVWTKVASSESGNYTATHSSAETTGFMWRISGAADPAVNPNPTTVFGNGDFGTGGGNNVITVPTLTTPSDNSALLWVGGTWDAFGAATPTSGWDEQRNVTTEVVYIQDRVLATAGATGSVAVTSAQGSSRPFGGIMVCVESAAAGGGGNTAAVAWIVF